MQISSVPQAELLDERGESFDSLELFDDSVAVEPSEVLEASAGHLASAGTSLPLAGEKNSNSGEASSSPAAGGSFRGIWTSKTIEADRVRLLHASPPFGAGARLEFVS